ncbi:MAG: hypothetical protein IPQ01_05185 [Zoogloea sp.]|nr:hypothetical protein [Zoogloea sp.]
MLDALLNRLREDGAWAKVLALPEEFGVPASAQMMGLAGPLRQHHAGKHFPEAALSFLGDLYLFGADWRDSALDKGSGGSKGGEQQASQAEIANTLGLRAAPYDTHTLAQAWQAAIEAANRILLKDDATQDLVATRQALIAALEPVLRTALGETRRPTNDVSLWHHSRSAASHFKAAVAEGVLRGSFTHLIDTKGLFDFGRLGRVRFRLLGIRWDWAALTARALRPVTLFSLAQARTEILDALRSLVEERLAIGNLIYADDDGALVLVPGFFEGDDGAASEGLFRTHVVEVLAAHTDILIARLGTGTAYRLAWSDAILYLTDYREALSRPQPERVLYRQAGVDELRAQWAGAPGMGGQVQICPQCGLRPALAADQEGSALDETRLCGECSAFGDKTRAGREAKALRRDRALASFGIEPETFNLQELCGLRGGGNRRAVLLSVQVDGDWIASGNALVTQLARPSRSLKTNPLDPNALAATLGGVMADLRKDPSKLTGKRQDDARILLGEQNWLGKRDGRAEAPDPLQRGLQVAEEFLLRESAPLTETGDPRVAALGLIRPQHADGDRLALFAMRRHASPARLARLWEDLQGEWKALLAEVHGLTQGCVIPLTLDGRGVSLIIAGAGADADMALTLIQQRLAQAFSKVRGGFAPHVSAVAFRDKFPMYVALDALRRLESRITRMPWQHWTLIRAEDKPGRLRELHWQTADGELVWQVDLATADPEREDAWLPHVIALTQGGKALEGPERVLHMRELQPGDQVLVPPSSFDFVHLETTTRRHALRYSERDGLLVRPHLVFGAEGRPAHHLEQYADGARGAGSTLGLNQLITATRWPVSKLKGVLTQLSETHGAWVRDVPVALQESGRLAWLGFVEALLARERPGRDQAALRAGLAEAIANGRFFDACEWIDFIGHNGRQDIARTAREPLNA